MPKASREEALVQLELANETRLGRAALCRRIRAGEVPLPDLIDPHVALPDRDEIEPLIANMPVDKLIRSARSVGARRYVKLWRAFSGGDPKVGLKVRELSPVRRARLAEFLKTRGVS